MSWWDTLIGSDEPETETPAGPVPEQSVRELLGDAAAANPVQDAGREWQHTPSALLGPDTETPEDIPTRTVALPEVRIEARRPREPGSSSPTPLDRLLDTIGGAAESGVDWLANPSAREDRPESGEVAQPFASSEAPTATDALVGALHGSGLGALVARLGDYGSLGPSDGSTHEGRLKAQQFAAEKAQQRSPDAYDAGSAAGFVAPFLMPEAPAAAVAEGVTEQAPRFLPAVGRAFGEGSAYGLATSEGETPGEVAGDTLLGGTLGGLLGGGAQVLGRGARGLRAFLAEHGATADDALLHAIEGGREIRSAQLDRWGQTPEARRRAADILRAEGIVTPFATPQVMRDRAREAAERSYGRSQGIRRAFEEAGGVVPIDEAAAAIREQATEAGLNPTMHERGIPDALERVASAWESHPDRVRAAGGEVPVIPAPRIPLADRPGMPLSQLEEGVRTLGDSLHWPHATGAHVSLPEEVGQETYRRLRSVGDEAVAATLGGDEARRFAEERIRTQVLQRARQRAALAADRAQGGASASMREMMAGQAGATIGAAAAGAPGAALGAAGARGAVRGLRPSDMARRAWLAGLSQRLAEGTADAGIPAALRPYLPALRRAAIAGTLEAVDDLLQRSDPDYAAAVEEASQAPEEAGAAVADEGETFDPSMLEGEGEMFDPSMLEPE